MQTTTVQYKYSVRAKTWVAREKPGSYQTHDSLKAALIVEATYLADKISGLSNLEATVTPVEEAKLVFALEALLDMRRELLQERT